MQHFSIKQIEQLSGIKAHTLRIWEKRYNLIAPDRTGGKQRTYSNEDLKSILRVVYLYNKGLKISKIARLNEQEILKNIGTGIEDAYRFDEVIPRIMEACIDLDDLRISTILDDLEYQLGLEEMMFKVLYPFLEKLGRAWVTGKVLPNNEHFVSHMISGRIILAISRLNRKLLNDDSIVLLFQPQGELHEIPLLFINYLLLKNGCKTVYFGSNISMEAISYYCSYKRVTHIHYHVITNLGDMNPQEYLDSLSHAFEDKIIVASGPNVNLLKAGSPNIQLLKNQDELIDYTRQFYKLPGEMLQPG